ncbi:hypothetical protein [Hafnia phage yong3]|nr:hypothetical protein [Hafnia phage yong3]
MSSKIYKLIGWKPWTLRSNYNADHMCTRCPKCGSKSFEEEVTASVCEWDAAEIETYCLGCTAMVNFWAYGSYDPSFQFSDRSFEMFLERMQYRLRGLSQP